MGVVINEAVEAELRKLWNFQLKMLVNEDEIDLMLSSEQLNSIVSQSLIK